MGDAINRKRVAEKAPRPRRRYGGVEQQRDSPEKVQHREKDRLENLAPDVSVQRVDDIRRTGGDEKERKHNDGFLCSDHRGQTCTNAKQYRHDAEKEGRWHGGRSFAPESLPVRRSPLAAKRLETSRLFDPFDAALQAVCPVLALIAENTIIIPILWLRQRLVGRVGMKTPPHQPVAVLP